MEPKPKILEKAMKNCCNAVQPHHYSTILDKERMCEFFKKFRNQMFSMRVMSVNTVVDYTLSVEVPQEGSYYVRVKPIGLLSLTTREGMSLYDTRAPENDLHMNCMDSHSIQMVTRARNLVNERLTFLKGRVSFEALGIEPDNTSCNLQVMLWDSEGNNLLSWMLKEGIAGLVGGSNYWNPETGKRDEKVRCLCPYGRSVTDDGKEYQPFQYSPLEWMLVDSEREAIRERKGMWAVKAHDKSMSPAISRVGNGKRHIFIDSSNLWILQKKLSGKVKGKNDMFMQMDEIVSSGQGTIDGDHGSFSTAQCKRFKSSYYDEDPTCRTHFKRLGDLLGCKKGHDPSPQIFGSVPPDNDQLWCMYEEVFGPKYVYLTKCTKEGKSTMEDQDLISVMLLTDYNIEDDLILVAGDGGYCTSLMRLMEKAVKKGPGKVYVVSWGNCSIQLKHLRNVVFINLDPYLKYLEHVSDEGRDGGSQSGQCQDTEEEEEDETLQDGDDDDY